MELVNKFINKKDKKTKKYSKIILATSTDKSDSVLIKLAKKENIKFLEVH